MLETFYQEFAREEKLKDIEKDGNADLNQLQEDLLQKLNKKAEKLGIAQDSADYIDAVKQLDNLFRFISTKAMVLMAIGEVQVQFQVTDDNFNYRLQQYEILKSFKNPEFNEFRVNDEAQISDEEVDKTISRFDFELGKYFGRNIVDLGDEYFDKMRSSGPYLADYYGLGVKLEELRDLRSELLESKNAKPEWIKIVSDKIMSIINFMLVQIPNFPAEQRAMLSPMEKYGFSVEQDEVLAEVKKEKDRLAKNDTDKSPEKAKKAEV